jgi:hypothetical protein
MTQDMTYQAAQKALMRLSDPQINSEVMLASTPAVAKLIVRSLPGVRRLSNNGPEAARAVLAWLDNEDTVNDDRRSAIALYILEHYPSDEVKLTLAKYISARRFTAFNSQLAADAFLRAAGIQAENKDAVGVALREAKKIMANNPPKMKHLEKQPTQVSTKAYRKKSLSVKK